MDRNLATETASQQAVRALADRLVRLVQGARLPTMQELNSEIHVGVGTLQKAIMVLREAQAVDLRARGHMGTYIEALDHARLWNLAGRQPPTIMLPFVDAPEFRGLSDGITRAFDHAGIRIKLEYRRGAATRLKSVSDGKTEACVVSRLAVRHHRPNLSDLQSIDMEGVNYYRKGSVVVISRSDGNLTGDIRIGFDRESLDHSLLTKAEFAPEEPTHTYVPCSYGHLITALMAGLVDCGIWHYVDLGLAPDLLPLSSSPLRNKKTLDLMRDCESACLVFRSDRQDIANIFHLLDPNVIAASQQKAGRQHDDEVRVVKQLIKRAPTRIQG